MKTFIAITIALSMGSFGALVLAAAFAAEDYSAPPPTRLAVGPVKAFQPESHDQPVEVDVKTTMINTVDTVPGSTDSISIVCRTVGIDRRQFESLLDKAERSKLSRSELRRLRQMSRLIERSSYQTDHNLKLRRL